MHPKPINLANWLLVGLILLIFAGLLPVHTPFSGFWFGALTAGLLFGTGINLRLGGRRKLSALFLFFATALFVWIAPIVRLMDADSYSMSGRRYNNQSLRDVLASEAASRSTALPVRFWLDASLADSPLSLDTHGMRLGDFLSVVSAELAATAEVRWRSGCCGGLCNPDGITITVISRTPSGEDVDALDCCSILIDPLGVNDFSTSLAKTKPGDNNPP